MGVLLIWCPASGRAFSTGIETDARSFASLPNNPARAKCPHCGEVHGSTVSCRVSHEALRGHADRMRFSGTDGAVFEAYRELVEEIASEAHDAEGPFDDHGRILVTSEALTRVMRSA
jgi:hypothetical protein